MKVRISVGQLRGKRVIRCVAKIMKSDKHNIPRTVQKTWRVCTDLAEPDESLKLMFRKQATRWHYSKMMAWFGAPDKFPEQVEIDDERDEKSQPQVPVPGVQQAGLVSGGQVSGDVHASPVDEAEGPR